MGLRVSTLDPNLIEVKNVFDRAIAGIFIVVSLLLLYTLRTAPLKSALFPGVVLLVLIGLSLTIIIRKVKERKDLFVNFKDVIIVFLLFGLYIILLPRIGFLITTVAFLIVSLFVLGYKGSKLKIIIISTLVALCIYFIFANFLHVNLP